MKKLIGYLRLMRLANIITAISDVLAGAAIGGSLVTLIYGGFSDGSLTLGKLMVNDGNSNFLYPILLLVLSTIGLYGGGVVLNDVFDAKLDKKERPERPIPSGLIGIRAAAIFGITLLVIGIVAAALSNKATIFSSSTIIAIIIALASVVYDKWSKHNNFFGPLNMGGCRGLNLLLGMSFFPISIQMFWWIALVPVIYIAAITMISRGEVHGGKRNTLYFSAVLYIVVLLAMLIVSLLNNTLTKSLPLALICCLIIFPPLQQAIIRPGGPVIGKAVKAGIIGLIVMNATWAAAFGDLIFAGIIFLLLPVSYLLARLFAVT